ncbi:hypothetical protein ALC57_15600 [Trachymyrmex cornetzi]|uniref:MADF domain-containing protein n=1 Tax=Trachymyrmex cornetzi TaxID=471704 RepID=A0A151IWN1_9HYME|nr:hypothetical protein ALC57_15600 [Trachymyrmex cornetzi]
MDTEEQYDWDILEETGEEWQEFEIRSMIAHVKANKFLIDKTEKDFRNKEKKDNAWKIIAALLNREVNSGPYVTEKENNEETTLLFSKHSPLHVETVSRSNSDKEISMSTNNTENKKYLFNTQCKRKVPAPDGFHVKKKKELESCSARMPEVSQHMNDTLTAITRSLKNSDDDLQYFTCLLPMFKKLNDD